ncbi:LOW QUALITY PROTEIN: translation protein SH3-like domain-containing protein [Jimgerdemannia flammicorona]|uniref:Translation protein SH3-like domain-containing protein n=1 Tax=Jimgerdemannia flammicorona TaxID=994334 RepID=A0A433PI60_9FUNG|nr:LOW QUALITY PROTEIN: translation protein SH3-like domain-containing protein [Jimgerdemannia flammicorona]
MFEKEDRSRICDIAGGWGGGRVTAFYLAMHSFKSAGKSTRYATKFRWVQPKDRIKNWKVMKGDEVVVIAGKDKGEKGEVISVQRKTNSVFVKDLKLVKKHIEPTNNQVPQGWAQISHPIHVSNVMLQHPTTKSFFPPYLPFSQLPSYIEPAPTNREPVRVDRRKVEVKLPGERMAFRYRRFVHNTDIEIEKKRPVFKYRTKDEPLCNTPREVVSEITFKSNLAEPPLPKGVINELRNPYYKFPYRQTKRNVEYQDGVASYE